MINRRSSMRRVVRKGWGGSYADSFTHAEMFRTYSPTNFGMMDAQLFASTINSNIINKPLLWLTQAQGNVFSTDPGKTDYTWQLSVDSNVETRVTRNTAGTTVGAGNVEFDIFVDKPWFHEPVLLKTDSNNAPLLRIIGHPVQVSANEWRLTVKVQDGSALASIDTSLLAQGSRLMDGGTSTADELNIKYGGDYMTNHTDLYGQIGYVGRKIEVTDKFIRLEMSGKTGGTSYGMSGSKETYSDAAIGVGFLYQQGLVDKTSSTKVSKGSFITLAEARLAERLNEDKEMMMEFGRLEITTDPQTGRPLKVGAGYRQKMHEGNTIYHSGTLTLYQIYEAIMDRLMNKIDIGNTEIVIRTGRGGIEFFGKLVNAEASGNPFVLQDSYYIKQTGSEITPNALKFGAQFTEILMPNGVTLKVMYDPSKDNLSKYPELVPGSKYTVESFAMDIVDLGESAASPANSNRANVAMVYEEAYEEYFSVSNVYNIYTGAVKDGGNVSLLNKEAGIYRGSSCGLEIWDLSRMLRFEYVV